MLFNYLHLFFIILIRSRRVMKNFNTRKTLYYRYCNYIVKNLIIVILVEINISWNKL